LRLILFCTDFSQRINERLTPQLEEHEIFGFLSDILLCTLYKCNVSNLFELESMGYVGEHKPCLSKVRIMQIISAFSSPILETIEDDNHFSKSSNPQIGAKKIDRAFSVYLLIYLQIFI
jgi:hypothetical protein